jgi:hypothetical protein
MSRHPSRFVVVCLVLFAPFAGAVCASNQYDMSQWVQLSPSLATSRHLSGNANALYYSDRPYDSPYEIVQMKGSSGYPWDVDIQTGSYIYQWATENVWNDPTTYKAFATKFTMPWMPRCITKPSSPGKLSSLTVVNPAYSIYSAHCTLQSTNHLGNTVNEVWGPYAANFGGNLPNPSTYVELAYRYSCDLNYNNCKYKETFDWVKNYGLVRWTYYVLQNGVYVQQQQNYFNTLTSGGAPTPDTPCFN